MALIGREIVHATMEEESSDFLHNDFQYIF